MPNQPTSKGDHYTWEQGFEWVWLRSAFLFLGKMNLKFLVSARMRNEEPALLGSLHCKWRDGSPEPNQSTLLGNIYSTVSTQPGYNFFIHTHTHTHNVCAQLLQSCSTLCDPMDCSLPGSFVHGIFLARIMEWIAMPSSRGSSQPRDQIHISYIVGRFSISVPPRKPHIYIYIYIHTHTSNFNLL